MPARKIIIARHAERVDQVFEDWKELCFDNNGSYCRADMNMPKELPSRAGYPNSYYKDTPLTQVGELQARLTGEAIAQAEAPVTHVFVSPAYRCVQTATNMLKGMGLQETVQLHIEPGMFEWLGLPSYYQERMPQWMSTDELVAAGFNINTNYTPVIAREELRRDETREECYNRSFRVVKGFIDRVMDKEATLLCVGHASSLDTLSRQLLGHEPRNWIIIPGIPYAATCILEETDRENADDKGDSVQSSCWKFKDVTYPTMTNTHSYTNVESKTRYDWKLLKS